jgi:SH3-like domain-containing protein
MNRRNSVFVFIVLILTANLILNAEEILYSANCRNSDVNIRKGPGTTFDKDTKGPLGLGKTVYIVEERGDWVRLRLTEEDKGWSAWTLGRFIKKSGEVKKTGSVKIFYKANCMNSNVNLRKGPGTSFEKDNKGPLGYGKTVYVIEEKGKWVRLRFNEDDKGWSAWTLGKFIGKAAVSESKPKPSKPKEYIQKKEPVKDTKENYKTEVKMITPMIQSDEILYTAVCIKANVNIRKGPGTTFEKDLLGPLSKGRKLYVVEERSGWIRFKLSTDKSWTGWILGKFVIDESKKQVQEKPAKAVVEEPKPKKQVQKKPETTKEVSTKPKPSELPKTKSKPVLYSAKCERTDVNIRKGPGANYAVDSNSPLRYGTNIYVIAEVADWVEFRMTQNDIGWSGWVHGNLLKKKKVRALKDPTVDTSYLYSIMSVNDEVDIRTGPGESFKVDDIGKIMQGLEIYVIEEKGDWVKFNLLPGDKSWSGWVQRDLIMDIGE